MPDCSPAELLSSTLPSLALPLFSIKNKRSHYRSYDFVFSYCKIPAAKQTVQVLTLHLEIHSKHTEVRVHWKVQWISL